MKLWIWVKSAWILLSFDYTVKVHIYITNDRIWLYHTRSLGARPSRPSSAQAGTSGPLKVRPSENRAFLKMGRFFENGSFFENGLFFWKWVVFLKMGHFFKKGCFFENELFFGKLVFFLKWVIFLKMGVFLKMGRFFENGFFFLRMGRFFENWSIFWK